MWRDSSKIPAELAVGIDLRNPLRNIQYATNTSQEFPLPALLAVIKLVLLSNMPAFVDPITDENNPLYCPAVPATTYLNNLRLRQLLPQSTNSGSPNLSLAFDFRLKQLLSRQSHGAEEPPASPILDISPCPVQCQCVCTQSAPTNLTSAIWWTHENYTQYV